MLQRMDDLLCQDEDFAFETTLASRSYTKFIEQAHAKKYFVTLLFFWLPTPELAIERVAKRVQEGGHNIPEDVIRRRYDSGIRNFRALYMPACDFWTIYDNSGTNEVKQVAWGQGTLVRKVLEPESYKKNYGTMSEMDLIQLQEKIDNGVRLAQRRLIERTIKENGDLVVEHNGEIIHLTGEDLEEMHMES